MEMVETLLYQRYDKLKANFARNNSKAGLIMLWNKLRMEFNKIHNKQATCVQLKNKLNTLKREFKKILEQEQGNRTDAPIYYPDYWDILVNYLGNADLRDFDYCQSLENKLETGETLTASDFDDENTIGNTFI